MRSYHFTLLVRFKLTAMKKPIIVIAMLAAALGAGSYLFAGTEADAGGVPAGFG